MNVNQCECKNKRYKIHDVRLSYNYIACTEYRVLTDTRHGGQAEDTLWAFMMHDAVSVSPGPAYEVMKGLA